MSTRWYPRFVRGNPQLRVFLPDFWMVIKKPDYEMPPNKVLFKVPVQMTDYDVRNYLERIYKLPVVNVQTRVVCGDIKRVNSLSPRTHRPLAYMAKNNDYREAIVDFPKYFKFEYPNLFPDDKESMESEVAKLSQQIEHMKNKGNRQAYNENRHNVPNWFGI